jgi:hypothetical protein
MSSKGMKIGISAQGVHSVVPKCVSNGDQCGIQVCFQ